MNTYYLETDNYSVAQPTLNTALWVHEKLCLGETVALPVDLRNSTMLHMSFVPLWKAVPGEVYYMDGSNLGTQINIDRFGSYALPKGSTVNTWDYLAEKFNLSQSDAEALLPFLNTILTGQDYFTQQPMMTATIERVI